MPKASHAARRVRTGRAAQTFGDTGSLFVLVICFVLKCWLGSGARDVSRGEALLPLSLVARSHPAVQCRVGEIWGLQHCGAGGAGPLAIAPHCPALICATKSHELPLAPLVGLGENKIPPEGSAAPEARGLLSFNSSVFMHREPRAEHASPRRLS